jgi:tripartite-type tricarboxylate transporter receptor subunit TctC
MKPVFALCLAGIVCWACALPPASAQEYPVKPMRLIVPFPPGGGADSVSRIVGQKLSAAMSQNVLLDNRPGAGTIIATDLAAKAAPDGYTLLLITAAFTANPSLYRKLPHDWEKDLSPAHAAFRRAEHPFCASVSARCFVKELFAHAKASPNQLNFGSAGGTSNHFAGEMFRTMAAIGVVHVPYKGTAPSIADLIGGRMSWRTGSDRRWSLDSTTPRARSFGKPCRGRAMILSKSGNTSRKTTLVERTPSSTALMGC